MMRYSVLIAVLAAAVTFGSIACGSSASKSDVSIQVKAENNRFSPSRIELPAGKTVKLTLQNLDMAEHDLEVRGIPSRVTSGGGHGDHASGAGMGMSDVLAVHSAGKKSASVTFVVDRPGTYEVVCTQPGHKEVGMVGTLVVTETTSPAGASTAAPAASTSTATPAASTSMPQMQPPGQGGHEGH